LSRLFYSEGGRGTKEKEEGRKEKREERRERREKQKNFRSGSPTLLKTTSLFEIRFYFHKKDVA
jgi:hypothetical protein